jgi:hypothetical protein
MTGKVFSLEYADISRKSSTVPASASHIGFAHPLPLRISCVSAHPFAGTGCILLYLFPVHSSRIWYTIRPLFFASTDFYVAHG